MVGYHRPHCLPCSTTDSVLTELEDICSVRCHSHQLIDNALRAYLHFTTNFKELYLNDDESIARCTGKLVQSDLVKNNKKYVRIQIVYSLLQEDERASLYIIASVLIFDGRHDEETFEGMNEEGCFARLLDLIRAARKEESRFQRLLLELLYEMSRVQPLSTSDLSNIDDEFVMQLFHIIEEFSDDVNDPYHYPVIRVLVS